MMVRAGVLTLSLIVLGNIYGCAAALFGGAAAGASVAHDRRTTGTMVDDQSIEMKIIGELDQIEELANQGHVGITSYNYAVLLTGEVPSEELSQRVEEIARNTNKVTEVYNELIVAPPSSLSSRSTDTWITTKVKTALFQITEIPDFDPTRVKVVTDRGVVYLFGLLNPDEADAVIETTRSVGGVQKVVTLFEYRPATATSQA